jgi:hypothetical protein
MHAFQAARAGVRSPLLSSPAARAPGAPKPVRARARPSVEVGRRRRFDHRLGEEEATGRRSPAGQAGTAGGEIPCCARLNVASGEGSLRGIEPRGTCGCCSRVSRCRRASAAWRMSIVVGVVREDGHVDVRGRTMTGRDPLKANALTDVLLVKRSERRPRKWVDSKPSRSSLDRRVR